MFFIDTFIETGITARLCCAVNNQLFFLDGELYRRPKPLQGVKWAQMYAKICLTVARIQIKQIKPFQ
jgi:hypothetical protein